MALVLWKYHDGTLAVTCSDNPFQNAFYDKSGRGGAQSNSDTVFLPADHSRYSTVPARSNSRCATEASENTGKDNSNSQATADKGN